MDAPATTRCSATGINSIRLVARERRAVSARVYDINPDVLAAGLLPATHRMAEIIGRGFDDPDSDWPSFLTYRNRDGDGFIAEFAGITTTTERDADIEHVLTVEGAVEAVYTWSGWEALMFVHAIRDTASTVIASVQRSPDQPPRLGPLIPVAELRGDRRHAAAMLRGIRDRPDEACDTV